MLTSFLANKSFPWIGIHILGFFISELLQGGKNNNYHTPTINKNDTKSNTNFI